MTDLVGWIVPAPIASDPRLQSTILDVVCGLDEEVEWHWTMTDRGPVVSGYSLVRRVRALDQPCTSHMLTVNVIGFLLLRIAACAIQILQAQRKVRDKLVDMVEKNRRLLTPIEEDVQRRLDYMEQRGSAA